MSARRELKIISGVRSWCCPKCKTWKPESEYHASRRSWNGISTICRKCSIADNIAYQSRNLDKKRDINREYMRRAFNADPEKFRKRGRENSRPKDERTKARSVLNVAVRSGVIKRPTTCENCLFERKVTGHHQDYSQPLVVKWLCYECHGREHRRGKS